MENSSRTEQTSSDKISKRMAKSDSNRKTIPPSVWPQNTLVTLQKGNGENIQKSALVPSATPSPKGFTARKTATKTKEDATPKEEAKATEKTATETTKKKTKKKVQKAEETQEKAKTQKTVWKTKNWQAAETPKLALVELQEEMEENVSNRTSIGHAIPKKDPSNKVLYYSTIMSFYHIRSKEQAKYEAVIHCSVLV